MDDDESVYDSEEDVGNNPMEVDDPNIPNLVPNNVQQVVADEGSIDDSENGSNIDISIADSEDEDEHDLGALVQFLGETFSLNVEGNGLDRRLITTQDGNIVAWEHFLLLVAKTLRFKECYRSMIANFKISNIAFENANLPETMREFWRIVNRREENFRNMVVCTICWDIIGEGKRPTEYCRCGECGPADRRNSELGTYLYISLRSQIQGLFSRPGMAIDLQYPYTRRKRDEAAIEDVYDGTRYQFYSAPGRFLHRDRHNYSFAMWVDGVSPAPTSNVNVVPVFIQILELSPRARQRDSMLAAIYVGPRKPFMPQFLTPVTMELQDLHVNGVTWRPNGNQERISRFMLLIVSADSEERYRIFGMMRHNGHCGCTFCLVDGEAIAEDNHRLIYPLENEENIEDRTDAGIRRDARQADDTGLPVNGVREISALDPLFVDLRAVQLLEPLHCFWRGNFSRSFTNVTSSHRPNHIAPRNIRRISERITSIRPPTKISRLPRNLESFAKFTATEQRNTSWYYWLPCAHNFLNQGQIRLFSTFAEATFITNKDSILDAELNRAEELFLEYRRIYQILFPAREDWVYNVHLLKHSVRCIRELGPAFVASGFWFESLNRQVVNYLTSPTDRSWQVACRMLLGQMVEKCLDLDLSRATLNLLREFIGRERWDERPDIAVGAYIRIAQAGRESLFDGQQLAALDAAEFRNVDPATQIIVYTKINIDGVMYQITNDRATKYDNSIAYVNNVTYMYDRVDFIRIRSIVNWEHNGEQTGIFGTPFRTIRPAFGTSYMKIVDRFDYILDHLVYVPSTNVVIPGVLVQAQNETYISRLPNRWDND